MCFISPEFAVTKSVNKWVAAIFDLNVNCLLEIETSSWITVYELKPQLVASE